MAEEPINTGNEPGGSGEKTFTQAELDSILGKRLAKAMKGMPDETELAEFRNWKQNRQADADTITALTGERDTAQTALAEATAKLEQYEREKYLSSKGVSSDDLDYFAFKIGQLVTADKTFEAAADEYLEANRKKGVRVETSAALGGAAAKPDLNAQMNELIRKVRK